MARSADAIINPELLVWGRETIGYDLDVAAKKIGVDPKRLAKWEKGDEHDRPTVKRLFRIANVYKRPFAAFYFSSPPTHWDEPYDKLEDWRTLPDTDSAKRSPGLVLELREAARRREILLDLANQSGEVIGEFDLVRLPNESPSSLAKKVRFSLGTSIVEQLSWSSDLVALRTWRKAIEELDVLVFQTGFFNGYPVQVKEMRGVALHFDKLPIIIMNSKDTVAARIFTIMHELGHLILNQSGLSNFRNFQQLEDEEVFCNEFAGELLVPSTSLLSQPEVKVRLKKIWSDDELRTLATRFRVSKPVILRRLLVIDKTTHSHYNKMLAQWKKEWEEKQSAPNRISAGGPAYHTKFLRCHGGRFVSSVVDAYDRDAIHIGDLSEYLGSKLKHIDAIRDDLAKASS
ncbi:MAG: XRE family transcriptional regulator [Anaerolineaceae bacterium]|nr:XRE family transcriptional regulator [Anaerolineaceae bacterium]